MAVGCDQCPQTFRTQSGKEWHLQHIHADLPIQDHVGQVNDHELTGMIENEITTQISELNSPLNIALDERIAGILAEVKVMIEDSDRFLREHIEHRIDERLQAIPAIVREPAKPVKVAEMNADFRPTFTSCSLHHGHKRSIDPRYTTRPMKIATDEMIRDALEYCGIAV